MDITDALLEQINRYLSGTMEPAERMQFEKEILSREELRVEVALQKEIKTAFQIRHRRLQLEDVRRDLQAGGLLWTPSETTAPTPDAGIRPLPVKPVSRQPFRTYFAAAASLLLILGLSVYFYNRQPALTTTPPTVVQAEKPQAPVSPPATAQSEKLPKPERGLPQETPAGDARLARYEKLFRENFTPTIRREEEAGEALLTAPRTNREAFERIPADTMAIKGAVEDLRRGRVLNAITRLKPATNCILPQWQANARWFLAMAYLRNKQSGKARQELQRLQNGKTKIYDKDAKALLKALENLP